MRVIQLGEQPDRAFCVGAVGIENIRKHNLMSKRELELSINFKLDEPYALVTFHPVTLERNTSAKQFQALLDACKKYKSMKFIFTKTNADTNGRIINTMIDEFVEKHNNVRAFASLGTTRYLSALKYSAVVIGNSSSGLVEAPSFCIPTINIGDRQKGRMQSNSVINCEPIVDDIDNAIQLALSDSFKNKVKETINPYGDGYTSVKVVASIRDYLLNKSIELKKGFFDCKVR